MKFILELESREVAHLSKTGILEAVIKELEENNEIVKSGTSNSSITWWSTWSRKSYWKNRRNY